MEIEGKTAVDVWRGLLKNIIENGITKNDEEGRLYTEIDNIMATVTSHTRIDAPITILNSLDKWMYPSLEEIQEITLNKSSDVDYKYSYGDRLFGDDKNKNQIDEYIIPLLKDRPNSRRAVAVTWNPNRDSDLKNPHIAGVICIDFKIRENKLDVVSVIRSNDMFFGWPANIYQAYMLQKYVADKIGVDSGKITTLSTSAHIYENQKRYIRKIISRN